MKVDIDDVVGGTLVAFGVFVVFTLMAFISTMTIREITLNECWPMCSAAQCGDHRPYASSKFAATCAEEKK